MRKILCSSVTGSVLVGNEDWTFEVPQQSRGGLINVMVFESLLEFLDNAVSKQMDRLSAVRGKLGIFEHEGMYNELLNKKLSIRDAGFVLDGNYEVYTGNAMVAFVKYEY